MYASIRVPAIVEPVNGDAAAPTNAGSYAVVGSFAGNDNYEAATGTATIVIIKATPTVTVNGGTFTFATTATATSSVGVYEVSASGLTSANYAISYTAGSLTITPVALTVRADSAERLVGAPNPALTASFSGFVLGETPAVLTGALTFTTPATVSSPIGEYPISPSGLSSSNYAIQYVDGTLTVTYGVCALYDQTKVAKSGSTIPIKLQLCDANGTNASSPSVAVTAERLMLTSTDVTGLPEDAGNANPDGNFRYADSAYHFNFQTKGLGSGKWRLVFHVANDPVEHFVTFSVK